MLEGREVLIAAISGRALAASAHRAGYTPLVADFFGDQDTLAVARRHVRFTGDLSHGIEEGALIRALETLGEARPPLGLICGTGFEDRPQLLRRVAERWRLFGNSAHTVARVKDPEVLSSICAASSIPFPELSWSRPASPADWLAKRVGGAGGSHVTSALRGAGSGQIYYQRKAPGTPVSALFLADGSHTCVLGYSAQWSLPKPGRPYRYGGAVRPAALAARLAYALAAAVDKLGAALGLVGLNSADFLVEGEDYWLLEINPRPGATLDIFEHPERPLFALHMAACAGRLSAAAGHTGPAKAAAIAYAERDLVVPKLDWPEWSADRPIAGSSIKAGEPLCTVYACGSAAAGARALVEERRKMILAWTRAGK